MKFIKTDVNNIAQRKLQLDNIGFLAANKNVSISPESSRVLAALHTSFNEQSKSYQKQLPGWRRYSEKNPQLEQNLQDLINGYLNIEEALEMITTQQTE